VSQPARPRPRSAVISRARIREDKSDYMILLAWNYADEIMTQQTAYAAGGGRSIVPLPEVRVVWLMTQTDPKTQTARGRGQS